MMDEATTDPNEPRPGGFWLRAGAYMLDGAIVGLPGAAASFLLTAAGLPSLIGTSLGLAISAAYFTCVPVARDGETFGKTAAGLAVVRRDGSPLTHGRAAARWAGYYLSSIPAFLGFLVALFGAEKRALHDHLADTKVVVVREIGGLRKAAVIFCGLLIPLAVCLGAVAAVLAPKFADLSRTSLEAAGKANLGALRAGLSIYYGDSEGSYPDSLAALTENGRYMAAIPSLTLPPYHPAGSAATAYDPEVCGDNARPDPRAIGDTGSWGYVGSSAAACYGTVFIDCTHTDSRGIAWHSY